MTVLDTFYMLFKSNAKETRKDVADLDKQIATLAEKGQKRSKDEEKSLKELRKLRQASTQDLKDQQKVADSTGDSFVKLVESATAAGVAMVSFGAIKSGIVNTAAFNSNLQVQGKLMGQNVQDIKVWGAAVEAAGGTVEGFQSALRQAFTAASNAGLPLPPVGVLMQRYHDAIKGLSKSQSAFRLGQLGVSDPGMQAILQQSDEDFSKSIAAMREHAKVTQEDADSAREFESAWSGASQSLGSLFTKIGSDVLPTISEMTRKFTAFTDSLQQNKAGMYEFFSGMIALTSAASLGAGKIVAGLGGTAGGLGILSALSRGLGSVGLIATGSAGLVYGSSALGDAGGHWLNRLLGRGDTQGNINPDSKSSTKAAMAFYMSQGYTRAQAAGIVANEQRESGGRAGARGDGGLANGLYQWHPDRAAAILAGTGIDVTTASAEDQRKAAIWEMKNSGFDSKLRGTDDPDQAARLFSNLFERPANGVSEAMIRGKMAIGIASDTAFSSSSGISGGGDRSVSIKIDEVNVHTQATDASGISQDISQQLNSHLRTTVANFDDGIAK